MYYVCVRCLVSLCRAVLGTFVTPPLSLACACCCLSERLVMRAAKNNKNINIVAVNDPFVPTDYMNYSEYSCSRGLVGALVWHFSVCTVRSHTAHPPYFVFSTPGNRNHGTLHHLSLRLFGCLSQASKPISLLLVNLMSTASYYARGLSYIPQQQRC